MSDRHKTVIIALCLLTLFIAETFAFGGWVA